MRERYVPPPLSPCLARGPRRCEGGEGKYPAYLCWSKSWTLAFTFDTRELNVRFPATRWEKHHSKHCASSGANPERRHKRCDSEGETKRTFGKFTKLFLHVRHRIPLRQGLLLLLLLRSITAMD